MNQERIDRLRKKMEKREASICSQRALLYTQSFKNNEQDSYILKKAKAFAHTLNHMDIYVEQDSLIFGNQASHNFAAPIFPEYSIQWVIDELDEFEKRKGDVFKIDEQTKQDLRSIYPYWKGNTHEDEVNRNITEDILLAQKQGIIHRGGISMSGDGHIVCDYEMILNTGFRKLIDIAKSHLDNDSNDYYQSVIISLEGALSFCKRFGTLLEQLADKEQDITRKKELKKMSEIACTMLEQPCQSFYEAVEIVYMIHVLLMIESNGHSFCFGRFDQYLLPFYQHDIETNIITKDDALEIITHMFIMLSSQNKVRPYEHTKFSQGYPLYSNLVVGGLKPDGSEGVNELSYLCIEAMHNCSLAEPNFSARYHQNSPRKFIEACAKLIATGCGMPSMFNDEVAIKGLLDLGIPKIDAYDYCPIGCVETGVPGKYGHRATGMTYVNWGKVLEIMLYGGIDLNTGICMKQTKQASNYDELWKQWQDYLKFYTDIAVECDKICDKSLEKYDADPFASCLVCDSLKLGKTLKQGGCRYDVVSQSNIGPSVVGNSLYTIKKLVFEHKEFTMDELLEAMKNNWQSESGKRIHKKIMKLDKFGNDVDEVDYIVKDVFDSYLELLPNYQTIRKDKGPMISCYTMSTSNITSYVPNGFVVGATPDGRMAGSPLNEGCSPTQGTDIKGPTALINSVSKLPNEKVAAGQLLNMRFMSQSLIDHFDLFVDFLIVSAQKGIYHNQFNVIDSNVLRQAQIHPEQYTDLIVRVAGYCAQFVSLMPQTQDAIIARTENSF
ncbi:MAG: formate C-acetyltransferase/glycerol dehydratase family glycyl radical enzyme [Erysipelotrichaceae bacterium]|uniref:glycyl radical protein n=1 Tax=Floccifex sp. TaxID=2815810 RepID=UPI002A75FBDA|nr:formate C-acetyltransferase/glycerol dehydratase family glycyl radical enzyme [Floccifex sp.]MDD7281290.1 formate C-acetyltransferase/glycerol dehydratase family glycyl radical enzyme [Erysipelotrichaceae bacterium]MDY2957540.1 formate C-acetyltransferase/glycerol dehydratase family glycyl radical enzyme [Floccifex sp.]